MDYMVSLHDACATIGCSYSKAQKLAKSGALPFRKIGSTWMIPRSVLYRELGLELPDEKKEAQLA